MFTLLKSLWRYRGFIQSSILNELKIKFARSRLGMLWVILQPFFQVLIYALILSKVLSAKLPGLNSPYDYVLYLMSGTLAWSLFNEIVTRCLNLFVEQANLIKKMNFPRVTLPIIVVGGAIVNQFMLMAVTMLVFICLGHGPYLAWSWLPLLLLVLASFSLGVGLILGVLNVFVRDIGQVTPILLQLLFWATPIVYPISIVPERLQKIISFNPLYYIVSAYQNLFLYANHPVFNQLGLFVLITSLLLGLSYSLCRQASPEMVDAL